MTLESDDYKSEKKSSLVVWDFDWSLINENSDYYPFEVILGEKFKLKAKEWVEVRKKSKAMSFVEFQDQIAWKYLFHDQNVTKEKFIQVLHEIPVFPENLHIVQTLHSSTPAEEEVTQLILSGANTELIKIILEGKKLLHIFPLDSHVYTNPARWEESKESSSNTSKSENPRLRVDSYIRKNGKLDCTVCHEDEDLCKGTVLRQLLLRRFDKSTRPTEASENGDTDRLDNDAGQGKSFDCIVYIGDGANDLCPIVNLQKNDFALVRKGKALENLVNSNKYNIKPKVLKWENGKELLLHFQSIFQRVKF